MRPTCKRCLRAGSQCPGYSRNPYEIEDQTARTVQKVTEAPIVRPSRPAVLAPAPRDVPDYVGNMQSYLSSLNVQTMNHSRENRIIFMQHVLELYMPDEPSMAKAAHFSYIPTIATIECSNRALSAARDVFLVVQLGTSYQDPLMLAHARQMYGDALAQIRSAIENKTTRFREETLVAITLAGLCEFFKAISSDGFGWTSHLVGASNLLASWSTFPLDTPLTRLIFNNLRNSVILKGLVTRKAVQFDQPGWLEQISQSAGRDAASSLNDIMVHIPALLEHSDQCLLEQDEQAISDILHGSWSLKRRLKTWYNRLRRDFGGNTYKEASTTVLPQFYADVPSRIFPRILTFHSFHSGYQHLMYWLGNFILDDNDIRLIDGRTSATKQRLKQKRLQLEQERLKYVNLICQGIPFCAERPPASIARMGVLCPLWFCQEFFRSEAYMAQLGWCREVYDMIFSSGLHPPLITLPRREIKVINYKTDFGYRF